MEIIKLTPKDTLDFKNLVEIFNEVFENNNEIPNDSHLSKLLANSDFRVFVVKLNSKVIGGLTMYILHGYYSIKPTAYIYDVGIIPPFQGQGYGKALLKYVCTYCEENGFEEAYVEAESEDLDAVNFYRKTNFSTEMNATHFTYNFKNEN